MPDVHAHEVMHMMLESGKSFSRKSLIESIVERFGADTRFRSCSACGMDAVAVVEFLESRGKFVALEDGFNTAMDRLCDH